MTSIVPARADTTYTFQGVPLRTFTGHFGIIPECNCYGKLYDGEDIGAITGTMILDGSPVNGIGNVKYISLSSSKGTISSDDDTYSAGTIEIIIRDGNIAGWHINIHRLDPNTGTFIPGDGGLFFEIASWWGPPNPLELIGFSVEGSYFGSYTHGTWTKVSSDPDADADGVPDATDNCPNEPNAGQEDGDQDGVGDACDTDWDNDNVLNEQDNCPLVPNVEQEDGDQDQMGDACDSDWDNDGVPNEQDNCPLVPNVGQADGDGDNVGDACDSDWDNDNVLNEQDNCLNTPNSGQEDADSDGVGNACDNCPNDPNPGQQDVCHPPPPCEDINSDNAACTHLCDIREIAEAREGTVDELYAKFWLCLNEGACQEYLQTGNNGIAGGFNKFMFNYMAAHPKNSTLKHYKCNLPEWLGDGDDVKLMCLNMAGADHFINELTPGFFDYCMNPKHGITPDQFEAWDQEHNDFVVNVNLPCFDTTLAGIDPTGLNEGIIASGKLDTLIAANLLREAAQWECKREQDESFVAERLALSAQLSEPPPLPPTKADLFSEEVATASVLKVTAEDPALFFLSVGTNVQLQALKHNPDGSAIDLTFHPDTRYAVVAADGIATVSTTGLLSIVGTSNPAISWREVLRVYVKNGADVGIGQFAVFDTDVDNDFLADSYEVRFGLDPNSPNGVNSDIDSDGLSDRAELMLHTLPTAKDTDGDGFNDNVEFQVGTDPRDAGSHPDGSDVEICGNCIDDNGDALVDLLDPQCASDPMTVKTGKLSLTPKPDAATLTLQGSFNGAANIINPPVEGVTLNLTDADGQMTCFTLPPGAGWKTKGSQWSFTDDKTGSLGTLGAKESLSISYNTETGVYSWRAKVKKTNLNNPDAGNVSTALTVGNNGFLNTQAWKTKGKKLVTP